MGPRKEKYCIKVALVNGIPEDWTDEAATLEALSKDGMTLGSAPAEVSSLQQELESPLKLHVSSMS